MTTMSTKPRKVLLGLFIHALQKSITEDTRLKAVAAVGKANVKNNDIVGHPICTWCFATAETTTAVGCTLETMMEATIRS